MSKQIAQTVGDKRIGWLLAIIAAFAMLAILATQWNNAHANVDGTEFVVTNDDPGAADGLIAPGEVVTYSIDWATLAADHVGSTTIAGTLDGDLIITAITPPPGPVPTCSGIGTSSFSCTYSAPLTTSSTGTLEVSAKLQGTATDGAALDDIDVTVDDESAQGAQDADVSGLTDLDEANAVLDITKADSPDPVVPGNNVTYTITVTNGGSVAAVGAVSDTLPSTAFASVFSATTTSGTCGASGLVVTCTGIALPATTGTATITIVGVTKTNPGIASFSNTANLTSTVNSVTGPSGSDSETTGFSNLTGTKLVHLSASGAIENMRDHNNNVIGYRHTVCALNDIVDAIWPNVGPGSPNSSNNFQIKTISGTSTISAPVVTAGTDCDKDGFNDDSTVSWYSTSTGEQEITVVNDAGSTLYGFEGTGPSTVALVKEWNTLAPTWITGSSTSPVAEAGTLTPSNAQDVLVGTNLDGSVINGGMVLNSGNGTYVGATSTFYEYPIATHANAAGTQLSIAYGAKVTITRAAASTCGAIVLGGTAGVDYVVVSGPTTLDEASDVLVLTSLGRGIPFTFSTTAGSVNDCTGIVGTTKVNIQVDYPILLGSDQPPAPALETLTVNWTGTVAAKQVFLAWAGQRIILEHDWRLPAGDRDGDLLTGIGSPIPLGECVLGSDRQDDTAEITFIKGGGPGNFLPGYGVTLNGSDQATVHMNTSDNSQTDVEDIVGGSNYTGLNDMCISRVIFESEDQGQVDIESFSTENGSTKHAFVIYYMKINTINVSLVTQVSKPSHNSSSIADYAPGNPWDASADDADNAAEWNVSKDLLVRGRVTGWFTTSNPSGRAADTSNPLNVLPADRWVMPNDWPLLAGGPADPADGSDAIGTAEQFRPYFDLMFAPNNTRGITLASPDGTIATQVAVVVANAANSTSRLNVTSCANLPAGQKFIFATSSTTIRTVTTCAAGVLTFSPATASVTAALTGILIGGGVPFEGPYSTIDIIGLAANGLGGAALSDIDPNNIRDAALGDGDVDWWDAPMPVAPVSVAIRGTGFIKEVLKDEVYYLGTPNSTAQVYTNPYYFVDIPASPFISSVATGGGYFWDTWSNDGPGGLGDGAYRFWEPAMIGVNSAGVGDSFTAAQAAELTAIRGAYDDNTIARDLVVYSDNHGEFMVTANGDYRTDLTACTTNVLAGGKHCAPGDHVGTGTITATVDYPDFRGKHFPVLSNAATVTWTWGGYKDVTVEKGETDQFKYVVFHAMDRDGFCSPLSTGAVLLHPVLSSLDDDNVIGSVDPVENVDFLIDSGEGIIVDSSSGSTTPPINDGKQFATGLYTFSTAVNTTIKEFPLSSLAASGATDECQAWIKVSNSLLGVINILAIAHDDEGNIGFDKIIDLTNTTSYTLNFRWSLITWAGADAITVNDAIKGTGTSGANPGGNDISASVTAIYGWEASAQQWLGFFPSGVNVPGANDLTVLKTGQAYWIAITGPSSVTWTIASNVN